jgi:enoyl-CoA hydratase/carnithine racemase
MEFVVLSRQQGIATVTLSRGKLNAINDTVVAELKGCFHQLEGDSEIRAVILTGQGKFFSFGFDTIHLGHYPKDLFIDFLMNFTDFYTSLFLFPKPVVAALNGHAVAGGCMLATACDYRIMTAGKAKIALNEINFGASLLAGSVEMLKFCVGERNAQRIVYTGAMFTPEEAEGLGLIDRIVTNETLLSEANSVANELAQPNQQAFQSIKMLLRRGIALEMRKREKDSILEFTEIWYSPQTQKQVQEIMMRG